MKRAGKNNINPRLRVRDKNHKVLNKGDNLIKYPFGWVRYGICECCNELNYEFLIDTEEFLVQIENPYAVSNKIEELKMYIGQYD